MIPKFSLATVLFLLAFCQCVVSFSATTMLNRRRENLRIMMMNEGDDYREELSNDENDESSDSNRLSSSGVFEDFEEENYGDAAGEFISDLAWRVEKLRLEEANKRRFLKARPIFLPYADARKWVQAWGKRWLTAQDWYVHY